MINWIPQVLLAQDADKPAPPQSGLTSLLIIFLPIMVVWFVMFILPQNKERAKRQDMLKSLKKNDPVVTIGGILGTVSHLSEDGKEVTLRIEDNSRIKVQREAIREVFRKDEANAG